MAEKVWAVSTGSYSDYHVLCVCRSREAAEAVAEKLAAEDGGWYRDAFVESLVMVDATVQPTLVLHLDCNLFDDGGVSETYERVSSTWPFGPDSDKAVRVGWRWVRAPIHRGRGGRLEVWGTDHKRVRKAFSDRRAEIRATDALRLQTEARGRA